MDKVKENNGKEVDEFTDILAERVTQKHKRWNKRRIDRNKKTREIAQSRLNHRSALGRTGTYLKRPKNSKTKGYFQRYSNRRVRDFKDNLVNGDYKKVFGLWNKLY